MAVSDTAQNGDTALLSVQGVVKHFRGGGQFFGGSAPVRAINGVDMSLSLGEVFCVVGESGCGKSTLARLVAGLISPTAGKIYFDGKRMDNLSSAQRRPFRRAMQMIFQNPQASLNPRMTVRQTLTEALRFHFRGLSRAEREERAAATLAATGMSADALARYPHEFSGGQRQRLSIARALIVEPQFIIADEPIAALDVSVRAQILNLLADLRDARGLAYLFITHDLSVVEHFAHRVAVMYLGAVCEEAERDALFSRPRHPYTQILLQSAPRIGRPLHPAKLPGEPPTPLSIPSGCAFHPRCPFASARCKTERPLLRPTADGMTACHAVEEGRI